jgi:hypothetical protein
LWCTTDRDVKECKKDVNSLYDIAKNRVYKEEVYNRELREIYGRIAFSRSCVLLSIFLGAGFLVVSSLVYFRAYASPATKDDLDRTIPHWMREKLDLARSKKTPLIGLAACVIGFFLASATFREEHSSMDLRVFGYYQTLCNDFHHDQEEKKSHSELSTETVLKIPVVFTNKP